MADKQLRVIIVGDAKSVQKAFQDTEQGAAKAEVKVEGFGKTFAKMGIALEAGRIALDLFARAAKAAVAAVADYNINVERSEKIILGVTKSQEALARAQQVARQEEQAGRGTYQETITALAALTPLANRYNLNLQEVLQTTQLLAALDPFQGFEGAKIAIQEALSGDFTSLARRFELPKNAIQELKDEGLPNLQIVQRVLKDLGIDQQFLNTANDNAAKKFEILKGRLTELIAVPAEPVIEGLTIAVEELNKALAGGSGESFVATLAQDIRAVLSGHAFDLIGIEVAKLLTVMADRYNGFLETISFGKLSLDGPIREWKDNIIAQEAAMREDINNKFLGPIGEAFGGKGDSPVSADKMFAAGQAVVASYLLGLGSGKIGDTQSFLKQFEDLFKGEDGKVNTEAFANAQGVLAEALQEVAANGEITAATFYKLTAIFGDQALNVAAMVNHYGAMTAAQDKATLSSEQLAAAKQREQAALDQLTARLRPYAQAVESATAAAKEHATASADAAEAASDRLQDVSDAAAASARENADAIDALQEAAANRAAAYAAQEAAAQAELTAIQERRREEAEKLYDTLVAGEQRALDAANNRLNALNRKSNKEDLALLEQIKAARDSGDTKTAAVLERRLKKQKEGRRDEEELERARAQVARDAFDEADEKADKEVARLDAKIGKEEEAAAAKLAAIQQGAKEQAAADKAAIDGAQDAAKADAERYRKQQEGIQDEIDAIQRAAKEQAKKDAQAITDATTVYNNQKTINDKLAIQLGFITKFAERQDTATQHTATAAKTTYENDRDRLPIALQLADAAEREAAARERIANLPVAPSVQAPSPNLAPRGGPDTGTNDNAPGAGGPAKPLMPWQPGNPPSGYHTEKDRDTNQFWWVPDGYHLEDYGKRRDTSLDTLRSGPRGSALRASGAGGLDAPVLGSFSGPALPAGAQGAVTIHLHITAPNLTDIGNTAQQRQLAQVVGGDGLLRAWRDIERGGGGGVSRG